MPFVQRAAMLEELYEKYNRRLYVHPDPLEFLYAYEDAADREVVGLLASCLAYGRVTQILRSMQRVLDVLGPSPAATLRQGRVTTWASRLGRFRHRFATEQHVLCLLAGIAAMRRRYGSLGSAFVAGMGSGDATVLPAMGVFVQALRAACGGPCGHLLSDPAAGSACKRLNLYLRWMVRRDDVDLGIWPGIGAAKLVVPLDTHMHRIALACGASCRRQADQRAAMEMTEAFRRVCPNDPVRYDFCLTRIGIRGDQALREFFDRLAKHGKTGVP